jgi:hypothetical protein
VALYTRTRSTSSRFGSIDVPTNRSAGGDSDGANNPEKRLLPSNGDGDEDEDDDDDACTLVVVVLVVAKGDDDDDG